MKKYNVTSLWESRLAERRQRAWQLASLCLHIGLICLLWVGASAPPPVEQQAPPDHQWFMPYAPPKSLNGPPVAPHPEPGIVDSPSAAGTNIESAGCQLTIQDDPTFELLSVLSRYHGSLGCADEKDPMYVTHRFQAPEWRPWGHGWVSIDSSFTVRISQPEIWPVVRDLRRSCRLGPGGSVYALFPDHFHALLDAAIRREAARYVREGRVSKATIAFSAKSATGFVVQNVTVEPLP
jgi:hypothetical protein